MTDGTTSDRILKFIRDLVVEGGGGDGIDTDTPLLEWGLLTSLNTVRLLAFLRSEFDANVSPSMLNASNFRDVRSIASLVDSMSAA